MDRDASSLPARPPRPTPIDRIKSQPVCDYVFKSDLRDLPSRQPIGRYSPANEESDTPALNILRTFLSSYLIPARRNIQSIKNLNH